MRVKVNLLIHKLMLLGLELEEFFIISPEEPPEEPPLLPEEGEIPTC